MHKEMREVTIYSLNPKNFLSRISKFTKKAVVKIGELLKKYIDIAVKFINNKIDAFEFYLYNKLDAKFGLDKIVEPIVINPTEEERELITL